MLAVTDTQGASPSPRRPLERRHCDGTIVGAACASWKPRNRRRGRLCCAPIRENV